jgi:hypothetical protein
MSEVVLEAGVIRQELVPSVAAKKAAFLGYVLLPDSLEVRALFQFPRLCCLSGDNQIVPFSREVLGRPPAWTPLKISLGVSRVYIHSYFCIQDLERVLDEWPEDEATFVATPIQHFANPEIIPIWERISGEPSGGFVARHSYNIKTNTASEFPNE